MTAYSQADYVLQDTASYWVHSWAVQNVATVNITNSSHALIRNILHGLQLGNLICKLLATQALSQTQKSESEPAIFWTPP